MLECLRFKSFEKGSLKGFADFYVPKWNVEICGCSLFMKDGKRWINLPSNEYKNEMGETKYAPFLRFKNKEHWEAFIEQAKTALDKWCSENQNEETKKEIANDEVPF